MSAKTDPIMMKEAEIVSLGGNSTTEEEGMSNVSSSVYIPPSGTVEIIVDGFGFYRSADGTSEIIRRYTWKTSNGMIAQVITYGATITSIKVPDGNGVAEDIVMGFDDMEGYMLAENPYFGSTVGRVANRIGNSSFTLNGRLYELSANRGKFHLHGGFKGLDKAIWKSHLQENKVIMTHLSKDGSEGYPGNLMVCVVFEVTADNTLTIDFSATSDKPTPVNLTNHSYFNLAGHGAGAKELYDHLVSLNADKYTLVDQDSIPTGLFRNVGGTVYDLRVPRGLGGMLRKVPGGGYDLNFCVNRGTMQQLAFVARALHPKSKRVMEIYSDQPGVQFYTGNGLPDPEGNEDMPTWGPTTESIPKPKPEKDIRGKMGARYRRHGAFCFETQAYPDAVNHDNFPSVILNPGKMYTHSVIYRFGTQQGPVPTLTKPTHAGDCGFDLTM